MAMPLVAYTININVNTSSPPHPADAPTFDPPANVSPKRLKGKVALSSQTDEQVWHLPDEKILGVYSGVVRVNMFTGENVKAASVEKWRSKAYQHYNVSLQCVIEGGL